jgi:hypothetical protein
MHNMNTQTAPPIQLTKQQTTFIDEFEKTRDHLRAAEVAGYKRARASAVLKSPRIQAALAERRKVVSVQGQPDASFVLSRLVIESQREENTGAARVSALNSLADTLGMKGGGSTREDGALSEFLAGIGAAVASGAFAGVSAAVSANVPAVPIVEVVPIVRALPGVSSVPAVGVVVPAVDSLPF